MCRIWNLTDTRNRFFVNNCLILDKYVMGIFFLKILSSFSPVRTGMIRIGSKLNKNYAFTFQNFWNPQFPLFQWDSSIAHCMYPYLYIIRHHRVLSSCRIRIKYWTYQRDTYKIPLLNSYIAFPAHETKFKTFLILIKGNSPKGHL